ncbi:hypothetical protein JM946_21815 [Steroidobacter sp. S1-65]|uniref:Uncharacterized protein n=1 Tax=Steroidobacter gossypii TaxID=2805490 RepID=A0ABS1X2D7_9GAMM|nr:hypothetical protein [Steroidobacter gossypii]MBM0107385.1 hypothetical protein [Steroidobacter gossypii]
MAQELTAADKKAIKDALVRELEKKIDTIASQVAQVGPTLTTSNRRVYEESMNKSIQDLRDQLHHVQAEEFRPLGPQEPISEGALVKARFEPAGLPSTETWILIVTGVPQTRLTYKGHEIHIGAGNFGYGGSLLGLRAGESSHVFGDGRSIPDYRAEVLNVL